MEQNKNFRAIFPPTNVIICKACYSCGNDVNCSSGFVDMSKPAFKGYLCAKCIKMAIGDFKASELLEWSQNEYKKLTNIEKE